MNWKTSHIAFLSLILLLSCKERAAPVVAETVIDGKHLITYDSHMLHSQDPGIIVVDFRTVEDYEKAHIPGAIQLYRNDFQDSTLPYPGMCLDRERTAARLGRAGISTPRVWPVHRRLGWWCQPACTSPSARHCG